jgi:hypothetical protein
VLKGEESGLAERLRRRGLLPERRRARTVPAASLPGTELVHLGGGETIPCPDAPTLPLDDESRRLGLGTSSLALPPVRAHLLHDVTVHPSLGLVVDGAGRTVSECVTGGLLDGVRLPSPGRRRHLGGTLAIYRSPARSRYHTLIEHLPRAAVLAHPAMRRFGPITLLHDGPLDPLEAWLLRRLVGRGVSLQRVDPDDVIEADRVLLPNHVTRPGAAAIPSWYRRWADRATDAPVGRGARRLFVEPPADGPVHIRNRADLGAVLDAHGVQAVDLDTLRPELAVTMFRDAEWILGLNGSGLSMAVFARRARVVELLPSSRLRPAIYYLAVSKGLPYDFVTGRTDGARQTTVDAGALDDLLAGRR